MSKKILIFSRSRYLTEVTRLRPLQGRDHVGQETRSAYVWFRIMIGHSTIILDRFILHILGRTTLTIQEPTLF